MYIYGTVVSLCWEISMIYSDVNLMLYLYLNIIHVQFNLFKSEFMGINEIPTKNIM